MTPKQRAVLEAIQDSISSRGVAPSSSELARKLDLRVGSVVSLVTRLESLGLIAREQEGVGSYHSIRLTKKASTLLGVSNPDDLLRGILRAWDGKFSPKWYDRLEKAIDKARPKSD